jgi:small subunit ribosomal protein S6
MAIRGSLSFHVSIEPEELRPQCGATSTPSSRQDLSAQQAQTLAETYAALIAEQGGEVTKTEYWGLRSLAYRIKKNRKGHYLHFNMRASAAAVDELERQERLNDDVIRYLTVKVEELDDKPSIQAQVRSSREERSRRHDEDRPRRHDDDRPRRSYEEGRRGGGERERASEPAPTTGDAE